MNRIVLIASFVAVVAWSLTGCGITSDTAGLPAGKPEIELRLVDSGSEYMRRLAAFVDADERAEALGITAEAETWGSAGATTKIPPPTT